MRAAAVVLLGVVVVWLCAAVDDRRAMRTFRLEEIVGADRVRLADRIAVERAAVAQKTPGTAQPSSAPRQSTPPTPSSSLRDRVASRLANLALRLATPHYRDFVAGAIKVGMQVAACEQAWEKLTGGWRAAEGVLAGVGKDEPAEVTIRRRRGGEGAR